MITFKEDASKNKIILASPCFHTLLQHYLTGIMGDNEYYKGQPSGRCKTIQEVSTGWFLTQLSYLRDGDDMLFQTYTKPIIKWAPSKNLFLDLVEEDT